MRLTATFVYFCAAAALLTGQNKPMQTKLMIVDPGHFHATLLQKDMYPEIDPRVSVYSRLGPELLDYLTRISLFNSRPQNPTRWDLDVHTSSNPMREMLRDKPGNAVVFTGRNRGKIERILDSLNAGIHVFADKPWIITSGDMPKLAEALELAERKGLAAYDIMTERYEATCEVQRMLVNSPEIFGELQKGSADRPGITAKSVHHIMKSVAGVPLRRPTWFFDTAEYGEGLADVGTHVVDLVQWTAFPDQALDYRKDIQMLDGRHWPVVIDKEQFTKVTGSPNFPAALAQNVHDGKLNYFCNNSVHYALKGVHVKLDILWKWEAAEGGDVYEAVFNGTNARVEIRQGKAENFNPEVYVFPVNESTLGELVKRVAALQPRWPGLAMEQSGRGVRIVVPEQYRVGHEAHFAQVATQFLGFIKNPKSMPAWERPNMLAKYYVSTKGVELAQSHK
jgi:predicted dehydrogenase